MHVVDGFLLGEVETGGHGEDMGLADMQGDGAANHTGLWAGHVARKRPPGTCAVGGQ
jgi:hypothetical protein